MKPGTRFRHRRLLDPDWKPGPGQRYADAPPAECRVTATRNNRVYYAIGDGRHAHSYFTAADWRAYVLDIIDE